MRAKKKLKHTKKKNRKIDYSDIPELSDEQLASMKRVGRPLLGDSARVLISIRVDKKVLDEIRASAKKKNKKYQSLINEILVEFVDKAG